MYTKSLKKVLTIITVAYIVLPAILFSVIMHLAASNGVDGSDNFAIKLLISCYLGAFGGYLLMVCVIVVGFALVAVIKRADKV